MNTRYFMLAALGSMLLVSACSDGPDGPAPDPPGPPTPDPITVADLQLKSFAITPEDNERIYAPVTFTADDDGIRRGRIEHYTADLTRLKASYEAVAAKVTVGDAVQVSGTTVNDFSKPVVYRLHADDGQTKEFTVQLENGTGSGLPVVAILTEGGAPVTSKEDWVSGRIVFDAQQTGFESLAVAMEVKGRGNNTWRMPKKPYAVKLSEKSPVLGMAKHKRWVLLANASDRTLLRNRVAFEIGRRTGLAWTSDSRFVEVILNGEYQGNYLLCEQIRVDKNRVNITEMEPGDIGEAEKTGGYLLEFDRYYDEVNKFRTARRDLPVNIKEPDEDVLGDVQRAYITDYVNRIEDLLYGGGNVDPAYRELLDTDSFIDWWIVMELTGNRDGRLPGSCYMYKDRGGKLCAGPLWDFDLTTFKTYTDFLLKDYTTDNATDTNRSLWYDKLFTDPVFRARAGERWRSYKSDFEAIGDFIGTEAEAIRASAGINWSMWTLTSGSNGDEALSWEDAAARLKTNYLARLRWLDERLSQW